MRYLKLLLVTCLLLLTRAAGQSCSDSGLKIDSPRIERLWAEIEQGDKEAADTFWNEVAHNTPLVEFIPPQNAGFFRATFLWRGTDKTCKVTLMGGPPAHEPEKLLSHLPGTDVWFRTERLPMDSRFNYTLSVTERDGNYSRTTEVSDPLNPKQFEGASVAELPLAPTQEWLERLPGIPKGKVVSYNLYSDVLSQQRSFSVYTPANYAKSALPADLVVVLDGDKYLSSIPAPDILDNLIGKGKIRPIVAVFIPGNLKDNLGRGTRTRDLTCNEEFMRYIIEEIVPRVRKNYNITRLPSRTVIAGESLGGLQATFIAFSHPEVFGRVISFSGSFFYFRGWPAFEQTLTTQTGWLTNQFATSPRKPIQLYLATGTFEGDGVSENRRMRDVLTAKGYPLVYREYNGGHERLNWRGLFPEALLWFAKMQSHTRANR